MPHDPVLTPIAVGESERALPAGILGRFFTAWRRWEDAMDYGPHDYAFDRLRGLEARVEQLEQSLALALSAARLPTAAADGHAISSAPR